MSHKHPNNWWGIEEIITPQWIQWTSVNETRKHTNQPGTLRVQHSQFAGWKIPSNSWDSSALFPLCFPCLDKSSKGPRSSCRCLLVATWTLVMILVWVECYSHWGTSPASKTIFIYIYRSWFIIPITNIYIEAGFIKPCYYHDILVFHSPCLGWLLHPLGFYAKHLIFEKYFGAKSTSSRFIETSQTVSWYFTKSGLLAHNRYPGQMLDCLPTWKSEKWPHR